MPMCAPASATRATVHDALGEILVAAVAYPCRRVEVSGVAKWRVPRWAQRLTYRAGLCRSSSRTISACCALDSGEPLPPRPVLWVASCIGVEPLLFLRLASAPPTITRIV